MANVRPRNSPASAHRRSLVARGLAALLGLALPLASTAEPVRVAFVDVPRILKESSSAQRAEALLRAEFSLREQQLRDLNARLQAQMERLDAETRSLSGDELARRQLELIRLDRELRQARRRFQADLAARKDEERAQLLDRAHQAAREVGRREGYDLVVERGRNHSARIDITGKVLEALNEPAR